MSLVRQFKKQFEHVRTKYKGTDRVLYVAVDIHETTLKPTHTIEMSTEFYPLAKETLQLMSKHSEIILILWTSTLPDTTILYKDFFAEHEIVFKHLNENPDIPSPFYADFSKKFFTNVIIDDKAGFDGDTDWRELNDYFKTL